MSEATRVSPEDAIDRIWELAKSIDFCMFVTWDGERQRARPLSARPNRDEGRIYFLTDVAGAKDEQIEKFPKVTLAFADVEGEAPQGADLAHRRHVTDGAQRLAQRNGPASLLRQGECLGEAANADMSRGCVIPGLRSVHVKAVRRFPPSSAAAKTALDPEAPSLPAASRCH